MSAVDTHTSPSALDGALRLLRGRRIVSLSILGLIAAYLVYAFFAFDVAGAASRARLDNARLLLQDFWSHKTHVTRDNRSGAIVAAIEGSRKMTYAPGEEPDWVHPATDGSLTVDLPRGDQVAIDQQGVVTLTMTDAAQPIILIPSPSGVTMTGAPQPLPDWINAADNRVALNLPSGTRLSVTRTRTEVMRRFPGWECFFFTLDSRWSGTSFTERVGAAISQPGAAASMWHDFWNNSVWHHKDVAWAMGETVLMAFVGTIGAALIALPLAFWSARNFSPSFVARFASRRSYDFLRGVDALIWTVILSRAFGPGPLTGALAILLTDIGTFGKLFSEALENTDQKQVEGLRATGAGPLQRARWGVIPQISPVMLSQVLYTLESNTRGATVIGAIVGGGIGLLLTQAIITHQDWEHVAYYIILVVLTVILMDTISGWLRRRLIKGDG
ncbi:MAG: phosphonate ABC transporter, permease protein PhnE [Paracoccus sp. (in: a-proteobacteria)]|nr:phosphonate ABC transporter, permease protein PhnE [Paracoccus sp. (in: a-proteobacteria)]